MKEKIIKKIRSDLNKSDYFFEGEIDKVITIVRTSLNKYIIEQSINKKDLFIDRIKSIFNKIKNFMKGIFYEKNFNGSGGTYNFIIWWLYF